MATILERMKTMPLSLEPKPEPQVPTIEELMKMMNEMMRLYTAALTALQKNYQVPVIPTIRRESVTASPQPKLKVDQLVKSAHIGVIKESADPLIRDLGECVHKSAELKRRFTCLSEIVRDQNRENPVTLRMIDRALAELAKDVRSLETQFKMLEAQALARPAIYEPVIYDALAFLADQTEDLFIDVSYTAGIMGHETDAAVDRTLYGDFGYKYDSASEWSVTTSSSELEAELNRRREFQQKVQQKMAIR